MEIIDQHAKQVKRTFLKADGRSYRAKRWKSLRAQFLDDLGMEDARLSFGQRQLLHVLCDSCLQLELIRDEVVSSQHVDPNTVAKLGRIILRISGQLGLEI